VYRTTHWKSCVGLLFTVAMGGCTVFSTSGGLHTPHDLAMAPRPPAVAQPAPPEPPPRELIQIRDQIRFEFDSDHILPVSEGVLREVAQVITRNPEIRRVRIEGNTDARGTPEHNQDLSTRRAAAVAAWLRGHGVAITIESAGRGQSNLLCSETTEECHTRNRRVEFVIVERAAASTATNAPATTPPSAASGT
jgi:OOP family OmpA-OmpF porin